MAYGIIKLIPSASHTQVYIPSGSQYASIGVLNPNDGVAYVAANRDVLDNQYGSWDWKVPSQSYALLPGPFLSVGIYYIDQSGAGYNGEITIYGEYQTISIPTFQAVGRAIAALQSSLDITQGSQPANPGVGITRVWADSSGNLHRLLSNGNDAMIIDTSNIGSQALGGNLSGTIANGNWNVNADLHARWFYTSDGSNGVVAAAAGSLYLRSTSGNYIMDSGGSLAISGPVSATSATISGHTVVQQSTGGVGSAGASEGQLELQSTGGGGSASKIAFHRTGLYAAYLGLDTDNAWAVGGWSMGAIRYRLALADNFANASQISANTFNASSNVYYFANNAGIFVEWNGTQIQISHNLWMNGAAHYFANNGGYYINASAPWMQIAPNTNNLGVSATNGQTTTAGGYDSGAHANGFLAPNNNPGGVGLAQSWGTWSSVEHARQYGLPISDIADPMLKVKSIAGVYYEHMNFDPVDPLLPEVAPRKKPDGSYDSRPLYGFSAKDVYAILPELVGLDPVTGEPESIDLDRMLVVLWEAVKELDARFPKAA